MANAPSLEQIFCSYLFEYPVACLTAAIGRPGHTVAFFLSMLMVESIFPGYEKRLVSIEDQTISVHIGGTGTPVLLLHGYPQNHATWIKLAVPLARNFTCVIADLPVPGESFIPADAPDHEGFSKRRMAAILFVGNGFTGLRNLQRHGPRPRSKGGVPDGLGSS